jgi:hypothetical protein
MAVCPILDLLEVNRSIAHRAWRALKGHHNGSCNTGEQHESTSKNDRVIGTQNCARIHAPKRLDGDGFLAPILSWPGVKKIRQRSSTSEAGGVPTGERWEDIIACFEPEQQQALMVDVWKVLNRHFRKL